MLVEAYNDNSTSNHSIEFFDDSFYPFQYGAYNHDHVDSLLYFGGIVCTIVVFGDVFTSSLAFVVLVRGRLWLKHEGYVYLAAKLCANVGILLFCTSSFVIAYVNELPYPSIAWDDMCKVWHFVMGVRFASAWLSAALLFNVCLREHLTHRRRCGCPMFAAKYCTLFATKIIVGVIFGVLFIFVLPYLAIFQFHSLEVCHPFQQHMPLTELRLIEWIVMRVVPLVFLFVILLIILCTKREGNTFGFSQIEERSIPDEQMRVLAVTLSSMTVFMEIAVILFHQVGLRWREFHPRVTMELILGLSLSLQSILCFIILKTLRDGFRSQLRNIRCCRRLFPSVDGDDDVVQLSAIQEDPTITSEA